MKKKIYTVKQSGIKDCGVACLLSIMKYYNGGASIELLRELTKTTKSGTTAFHLIEAANNLGLSAIGIKCDAITDLKEKIKTPFIAHVIINNSYKHFIVVYDINYKKNVLTIMDPSTGTKKISFDEFNSIWTKIIIEILPTKNVVKMSNNSVFVHTINSFIINHFNVFINTFLFSLLVIIFTIIGSYYSKIVIDNFNIIDSSLLIKISLFFIVGILFKTICNFFRNKLLIIVNEILDLELFKITTNHLFFLKYDYFKSRTTGEITSRINDLSYIKELISKSFVTLFVDFLLFMSAFFILFSISKTLFFITLIIIILLLLILVVFSPLFKKNIKTTQVLNSEVNSYLIESITNYETVKSLNMEKNIVNKLKCKYTNLVNQTIKTENIINVENFIKDLIIDTGIFIIMFVGFLLVLDKKISLGELITYNSLIIYFIDPIKNIIDIEPLINFSISSFKRIKDIFNIEKESLNIDEKYIGNNLNGKIEIKNLNYTINDKDYILNNINLYINEKEKVMVIGKSGSGKSTLLKLLLNYSKIERNRILIDNKDINDYNLKEYRNRINYISQNEKLFTDTIYNNIVLDNDIDYDKFLNICKICEVDKIISKKHLGYNTLLEEDSFNISGGEKARIILARSLIKEKDIFIFDEAFKELDDETERRITNNLFSKYKEKTIIIISHRLNNKDLYDRVINMDVENIYG